MMPADQRAFTGLGLRDEQSIVVALQLLVLIEPLGAVALLIPVLPHAPVDVFGHLRAPMKIALYLYLEWHASHRIHDVVKQRLDVVLCLARRILRDDVRLHELVQLHEVIGDHHVELDRNCGSRNDNHNAENVCDTHSVSA